jgi:hypothetical protein
MPQMPGLAPTQQHQDLVRSSDHLRTLLEDLGAQLKDLLPLPLAMLSHIQDEKLGLLLSPPPIPPPARTAPSARQGFALCYIRVGTE